MRDLALEKFETLFRPEFGHGKPFDLARLRAALHALGDPQDKLPPVFHVAGTNGKGSTIAFIRAVAESAGLRVHTFTSPHLLALRERFVVAGEAAGDEALIVAAERIARVDTKLTNFDAQVAAALTLFSETPADLALLETGMGGRYDSTNVIERPALSILTPIALDHQDALGPMLADIAHHKAGILKRGAPALIARQMPEASEVIEQQAASLDVALHRQGIEWDAFRQGDSLLVQTHDHALDLPLPSLAGAHQIDNAGLAVAALLTWSDPRIREEHIAEGVSHVRWRGRLQPLTRGALAEKARAAGAELWLDGGHNPHAARALSAWLGEMQRKRTARTALIVGMRARKDWRRFVETLAPHADQLIAVPIADEGAPPTALAEAARDAGARALTAKDTKSALDLALADGAKRILVCGSLSLVAEALAAG